MEDCRQERQLQKSQDRECDDTDDERVKNLTDEKAPENAVSHVYGTHGAVVKLRRENGSKQFFRPNPQLLGVKQYEE